MSLEKMKRLKNLRIKDAMNKNISHKAHVVLEKLGKTKFFSFTKIYKDSSLEINREEIIWNGTIVFAWYHHVDMVFTVPSTYRPDIEGWIERLDELYDPLNRDIEQKTIASNLERYGLSLNNGGVRIQ